MYSAGVPNLYATWGAQHLQCFIYIFVTSESKEQHIDSGNVTIDHILNPLFDQIIFFKGKYL